MKSSIIPALFGALLMTGPYSSVFAQDAGHEGHHPAAAEKSTTGTSAETQSESKMQGGMMGGEKCKMMEEMHAKMGATMKPKGDTSPASQAYNGIMMKMHEDMGITYTGNADVDFVKGMVPHHQAAVDMAKTALAFGKDPEVKKIAEDVIKAQEAEIIQLKAWLEKSGAK